MRSTTPPAAGRGVGRSCSSNRPFSSARQAFITASNFGTPSLIILRDLKSRNPVLFWRHGKGRKAPAWTAAFRIEQERYSRRRLLAGDGARLCARHGRFDRQGRRGGQADALSLV